MMSGTLSRLTPRQVFEDNMRPAELLLKVFSLLACDSTHTHHEILDAVRMSLGADKDENLLLLYNHLFVGIVRERAHLSPNTFKQAMLENLLRQSIAASCTALDTFLPALLRVNVQSVLEVKGRDFLPSDKETRAFLQGVTFTLPEAIAIAENENPSLFIANRVLLAFKDMAFGNATGLHTVGSMLGLNDPWKLIGEKLGFPGERLKSGMNETTSRRNSIIHRADRSKDDPDGEMQDISFAWTKQSVDNIYNACIALDELVAEHMVTFRATVESKG
jgi:hypothetical protein